MKTTNFVYFLLALAVCPLGMSLRAGQAPAISPEEDQDVVVDLSGDGMTIDFTASGGQCDPPSYDPDEGGTGNGDCTWCQDGAMYYVWEYTDTDDDPENGISGDPGSDDDPGSADGDDGDQSTLSIDESQPGSSSITVYAVQNWKACDGSGDSNSDYRTAVTRSPSRTLQVNGPHTNDDPTPSSSPTTKSPTATPSNLNIHPPAQISQNGSVQAGSDGGEECGIASMTISTDTSSGGKPVPGVSPDENLTGQNIAYAYGSQPLASQTPADEERSTGKTTDDQGQFNDPLGLDYNSMTTNVNRYFATNKTTPADGSTVTVTWTYTQTYKWTAPSGNVIYLEPSGGISRKITYTMTWHKASQSWEIHCTGQNP